MNIGYVRVSAADQNVARQKAAMEKLGVDKMFIDKSSGKDFDRAQYHAMVDALQAGDVVFVTSLDRLGRNYKDIAEQWDFLTKTKKADIVVMDMDILDTRKSHDLTGTLISDIVVKLLSYVAEKERENIRARQAEGIAIAKAAGKYKGRKPVEIDWTAFEAVYAEVESGKRTSRSAMEQLGLKQNTYYRTVNEYKRRKENET